MKIHRPFFKAPHAVLFFSHFQTWLLLGSLLTACQSPEAQRHTTTPHRILSDFTLHVAHAFPDRLATRPSQAALPDDPTQSPTKTPFAQTLPKIRHTELIDELYDEQNSQTKEIFVKNGILTPTATHLLERIEAADEHALNPADFHTESLRTAAERLSLMAATLHDTSRFELNPFELRALDNDLATHKDELGESVDRALERLCHPQNTPIPRAAALCQRQIEYFQHFDALSKALEYALADAWLQWAEQLKFGNLEKFSPQERERFTTPENPNDIHPKHFDRIIHNRLRDASNALFQSPEQAESILDNLVPQHEQYKKLQNVREKYRAIVASGGWKTVPADRMFAGGRAPLVKDLKNRLAAENYYHGNIDDLFDQPLTDAIKLYQKHHQLEENGEVSDVFWRSLNVPAEKRLAEIEVNLRRWHKTMFEPRDVYIYINVPSFTVELWKDGQRIAVHKTVVGNSTRVCNTRTRQWELINATPLMHSKLTYLVFNPYWNVPPRIEIDEFQKKFDEDPKWIEKSDFEYYTPKGGGRILRQKPGENNALGKVKLIFPNRYGTYLHDTPKQQMFLYPVRAFSHGCIRVEGAFDFAREILQLQNAWDEKQIERFYKESGEHPVDLKFPIDVFIEYHTVTVDDLGNPYFLADVYRIIRDEISPPSPLDRQCDPASDRTSAFRSGTSADTGP